MGAQADRMLEERARKGREPLVIDRTSSMTVMQVVAFWKEATAEILDRVADYSDSQPGLKNLARRARREELLDRIAEDALERVFRR